MLKTATVALNRAFYVQGTIIMRKTLSLLMIALLASVSLSACNTVKGVGQDMSAAGDKIEKEANQNKQY